MYALTISCFSSLAALVLVVLKLFGVIQMGWLGMWLALVTVTSLGGGLILIIGWLQERRRAWQPREKGEKLRDLPRLG